MRNVARCHHVMAACARHVDADDREAAALVAHAEPVRAKWRRAHNVEPAPRAHVERRDHAEAPALLHAALPARVALTAEHLHVEATVVLRNRRAVALGRGGLQENAATAFYANNVARYSPALGAPT